MCIVWVSIKIEYMLPLARLKEKMAIKRRFSYFTFIFLLIISLAFVFIPHNSMNIYGASTKDKESEIIRLFKAHRFKEIIELSYRIDQLSESESLLVAKSYERLGYYNRANRIYKLLYDHNSELKQFIACFIAYNYEKLKDPYSALKWYSHILFAQIDKSMTDKSVIDKSMTDKAMTDIENIEQTMVIINSFERLIKLATQHPGSFQNVQRTLKKALENYQIANYYLALLYYKNGDIDQASAHYLETLNDSNLGYRKKALDRIMGDYRLIKKLSEMGRSYTDLIDQYMENKLYTGALVVSYLLQYSAEIAELRAECYYRIGDYKTAAVLYNDYFTYYKDFEALLKIAFSYYYTGKHGPAYSYLQKYLDISGDSGNITVDALYLKLELERKKDDLKKVIYDTEHFIREFEDYSKVDKIIQDTFYYAIQSNERQLAVNFIKNNYGYIKSSKYKAWALYILGIYYDEDFLEEVVIEFPGSYYYFKASERLDVDENLIRTADRYYRQGRQDDALELYTQLYSRGINKEDVRDKITDIISKKAPYKYLFDMEKMYNGNVQSQLFELLRLGLYYELKEMVQSCYSEMAFKDRIVLNYILSKVSYETGDIYSGILYAERILNSFEMSNTLFLPKEILKILYPYVFEDIIKINIKDSSTYLDTFFILALIREESRYNIHAKSAKGAVGLMQLMPETASWVMKKRVIDKELMDSSSNIDIGIQYIKYLFSRFDSSIEVLAAYNGGPNNVRRWLTKSSSRNQDQFVEEIPFSETRNFIKKVFASYSIYKELYCNDSY